MELTEISTNRIDYTLYRVRLDLFYGRRIRRPYYAFSVFACVRSATAALQGPRYERWRHMRANASR